MKVVIIGTGFGRYAMAPVYTKHGFDVELVSPREPEAIEGPWHQDRILSRSTRRPSCTTIT